MPILTRQATRARLPRGRSESTPSPRRIARQEQLQGFSPRVSTEPPRASEPGGTAGWRLPVQSTRLRETAAVRFHPLTDQAANERLFRYESRVKQAFDRVIPVLKEIASHRCEPDFTERAQRIARAELAMELPEHLLDNAWVAGLDVRRLFGWVLFGVYRRISDEFFADDPLGGRDGSGFQRFLLECGFHLMDVTPCADGRLAHAISYVLRMPHAAVRRKSYAGALFDIENTVEKWVETELRRFREGVPNTADAATRYLKTVLYHFSSGDPSRQGCAAHGSDAAAAARAGWERLRAFQQAIENGFCCGASVELLLIGVDTDSDVIRVHVPDGDGYCELDHWLDAARVYEATLDIAPHQARERIAELVRSHAPGRTGTSRSAPTAGMVALLTRLFEHNISQIDYVRNRYGGCYPDIGHAERFIGVGIGFEEIQLRNLTFFAYLDTVEEGAADLDVGIKIFTGLNIARGLPVPIVVRFDYHGGVPGARERAVVHCKRITMALAARYPKLHEDGLLHCLQVVRDCDAASPIEIIGSSLDPADTEGH